MKDEIKHPCTGGYVIRRKCCQCGEEMILSFYSRGVFLSAFHTQIKVDPTITICEKCDPNIKCDDYDY